MNALYELQKDLHKHIKNSYSNFRKKGAEKMSLVAANTLLKGLESWYTQFVNNHKKILDVSQDHAAHDYFKSHFCDQVTDEYFDRKGKFLQFIEDEKGVATANATTPQTLALHLTQMTSVDHQSLPKITLPKFHGLQSEWENFRHLLRSIVHRRTDLDTSVKYVHLRSSLSDEALERIKSIPISAEDYERAWTALFKHYDNKRRAVNILVSKLFNVQPMKSETASELQRVWMEINGSLESLKALGRTDEEIGNDLLVHLFVTHFDANTKKDWMKSVGKENDSPCILKQVREFVEAQLENLESPEDTRELHRSQSANANSHSKGKSKPRPKTENESSTAHALQAVNKDSPVKLFKCSICSGDHPIYKCESFLKKSVSERLQFVKSKSLCFNCLGSKHPTKNSKSRYSCMQCRTRHHTLLHLDKQESSGNSDSANNSTRGSNCNYEASSNVVASSHSTQAVGCKGVLLATAQVCVIGPKGERVIVKALLDSCSQVSLVTRSLCTHLPQSNTHVCIEGVGDKGSLISNKSAILLS